MFSRIRITIGLVLLLTLIPSIIAYAKGGFSFITITGPNLKNTVRATDPALTEDFFAFADFYKDGVEAPDSPGVGYEITRYSVDHYVTGHREITHVAWQRDVAFDRLHYYPDTGFVYYDGIVNVSSEYDGKWYTAQPGIEGTFRTVITQPVQRNISVAGPQSITSKDPAQSSTPVTPPRTMIWLAGLVGLTLILIVGLRFRKSSLMNG